MGYKIFGSLHNRMLEHAGHPAPVVGMGCTVSMYSDRYAATIVEVIRKGIAPCGVVIQRDMATRTDCNGLSESQEYSYEMKPQAQKETYSRRKNGTYVKVGEGVSEGTKLIIGQRLHYIDPCF